MVNYSLVIFCIFGENFKNSVLWFRPTVPAYFLIDLKKLFVMIHRIESLSRSECRAVQVVTYISQSDQVVVGSILAIAMVCLVTS